MGQGQGEGGWGGVRAGEGWGGKRAGQGGELRGKIRLRCSGEMGSLVWAFVQWIGRPRPPAGDPSIGPWRSKAMKGGGSCMIRERETGQVSRSEVSQNSLDCSAKRKQLINLPLR